MTENRQYTKPFNRLATTPYLEINLDRIKEAYDNIHLCLPGIGIHYAMKCNPNPEIMKTILEGGGQFEISSAYEMREAIEIGADPTLLLFSNPIKTLDDIKLAYQIGVGYFAFDSISEVDKLAEGAPNAKVYIRVAVPTRKSSVASEGKFGVSVDHARDLMVYAKKCGLNPCGISFHVGSQMLDYESWGYAIHHCAGLIDLLKDDNIPISFLDIGGGFPVCYDDVEQDNMDKISATILNALQKDISKDVKVVAEPGRYLVADSGTMVSTVIGLAERFGKRWLHLDIGAHNGLLEALQTTNTLAFPVHDSKRSKDKSIFTLTGPTCDSQDTILFDIPLSSNITVGDKVYFECAGAYTTAFTGKFNGFPDPETYIIGNQRDI